MPEVPLEFDEWYRCEHRRVLAAVALVTAPDAEAAEDATNHAFVKALERWDSVRQMEYPSAWVTRVALNSTYRTFRRRRRRIELQNSAEIEAVFQDKYSDLDLLQALGELTQRQRRAIVLRYFEDMPQAGVARDLGISPGTAAATLHQARRRIRTHLNGEKSA